MCFRYGFTAQQSANWAREPNRRIAATCRMFQEYSASALLLDQVLHVRVYRQTMHFDRNRLPQVDCGYKGMNNIVITGVIDGGGNIS